MLLEIYGISCIFLLTDGEALFKQLDQLKRLQSKKSTALFSSKGKLSDFGGGSHGEKREWEVGQKGNYDNVDDGRSIKR